MTTVAEAIMRMLSAHGVSVAFGIPGVHNLAFWEASAHPDSPRIIGVRHEQSAVYAADGLFRTTGIAGAALLTSGPGAANALAAFGEAHSSGAAVAVFATDVSSTLRHPQGPRGLLHEMADQTGMFSAFGAPAHFASTGPEAITQSALALREMTSPVPTPVYVGVASDVLGAGWSGRVPEPLAIKAGAVDDFELAQVVELIGEARRPVLWLGGGVVSSGTEPLVRQLAERIGAVAVTTFAGRGLLAGSQNIIEAPAHEPEVAEIIADADLLIALGTDFDGMNTRNWSMPMPERRIAITLSSTIKRTITWDVVVAADLTVALTELLEELPVTPEQPPWCAATTVRTHVISRLHDDEKTAPAVAMVRAIDESWPAESAVICDMSVSGYWTGGYCRQPRTRRLAYPVGWGTLGYALPAAIGPASVGIPTLAVCGDGGPMFALGEFATIAQHSLPVTIFIVDDGGYGMLRFDQQKFGHAELGVDLHTPHWETLASAFSIGTTSLASVTELSEALTHAHAENCQGRAHLIVWQQRLFPPRTTSPRWHED
jgi:thiamine pyrophosphate-dependent acetolactate synthase large subunit-like protein